jgi:hypothetical protein
MDIRTIITEPAYIPPSQNEQEFVTQDFMEKMES